jgi:hypothetical protein
MSENEQKKQKHLLEGVSREKYFFFVLINVAKQSTIVD